MAQKRWGEKSYHLPGPVLVAIGFPVALEPSHEVACGSHKGERTAFLGSACQCGVGPKDFGWCRSATGV